MKKYYYSCSMFLIFLYACGFNCEDYLNKTIKPLSIHGIVIYKYKTQTGCFGNIILQQEKKKDSLNDLCYCGFEKDQLWKYVLPNDSLYKVAGSLKIYVVRNGIKKEFEYPCCDY